MNSLILPEEFLRRQQIEAQLASYGEMQARHANLRYIQDALKGLDPLLELVRASEQATDPALIPGCWHIKRNNETTIPTYYPICDEFGNYKEPDAGDVERLRLLDTQGKTFEQMIDHKRIEDKRKVEKMREEAREEMAERIHHAMTPSILVTKDISL